MTPTMEKFIEQNSQHKIVEGMRLTPEGNSVRTLDDMKRSNSIKYYFENGESFTLSRDDIKSAPSYEPIWML